MQKWFEELDFELKELSTNYEGNREADKIHRDLTEVHEKLEALSERLEWNEEIHPDLDATWNTIRDFVSSDFHNDQTDYQGQFDEVYARYEQKANGLVDEVSADMPGYHEMMAQVGSRTETQVKGCEMYQQALQLHWDRKWDESIEAFTKTLEFLPGDKAALSFIDRINRYKENPPASDWQGEFKQIKK